MRRLIWVVCAVLLVALVAGAVVWMRTGRREAQTPETEETVANPADSRSRAEPPTPTWQSDPAALAAAGLPDPSAATLGLNAVDLNGDTVGVRSIMPWMAAESENEAGDHLVALFVQELDHRVTSVPQLYNAIDRAMISAHSHHWDYEGDGFAAERNAALIAAKRLGQDCVLLGQVTGDPRGFTLEFELYDAGTDAAIGEPWTLTGTAEQICARDGEVIQEAFSRAGVDLKPAQQAWLKRPLTTSEGAFRLTLEYIASSDGPEMLARARELVEAAPDFPLSYGYLYNAERTYGSCTAGGRVIRATVDAVDVQPRQLLAGLMVATQCGEWKWGDEMIARHEAVQPKSFLRVHRAMSHHGAQGRTQKPLEYAEQLIDLNPRSVLAWWSLGTRAKCRAMAARAGQYVMYMSEVDGDTFMREMGRAGAAIPVAAEMDPLHLGLLVDLLDAYRETAMLRDTEAVFEYIRELYPNDPSPYSAMKWAYAEGYSNKPDKREALQKELEAFEPETYGQRFTLGSLLHSSSQRTARQHMREALKEAGDIYWPGAHATLAGHLARTDDTAAEAEEHARISLRQRYSEAAHRALVRALSARKKYPEAIEEAESLVEHFPHSDDARMVEAQTLLAAKKYVLAAGAFQRAHALDPRNVTAARQCVHAWLAVGRIEEAREKLFEMEKEGRYRLQIDPVRWGNYFLAAGQYGHALEYYENKLSRKAEPIVTEMNSGYCYFGMGDHEKARQIWEDHGEPLRDNPEYRLCMAMCDFADGDKEAAVRGYLAARKDDPEFFTLENLRYHYLPPCCIDIFKKLEAIVAERGEEAVAE